MKRKYLLTFLLTFLFVTSFNFAANSNFSKEEKTKKITGEPSITHFNINNISTFVFNNGLTDINAKHNSGLTFPKGTNKFAIYQSGLVWGGIINGKKHVGGSTYRTGLLPGKIIGFGNSATREDENLEHVRIYRVRRSLDSGFDSEINDAEGTAEEIRAQYEKDWDEWPAMLGAPFEDVDNNGVYNPAIDIPGFPGADQTIWYVANDLDTATCRELYGSAPMGIELQVTFWGYNSGADIGNTIFKKYKLINKSNNSFDSMYISLWTDPDVGDATDDLVGCDTSLSLMYAYNGRNCDATYGFNIPSVGFDFLQGPAVPSEGDTAIVNGKLKPNYKNLEMSAHYFFGGAPEYSDPRLGDYRGTLEFFNLLEGKVSSTGEYYINPITGNKAKYTFPGNPVTGTGWIDGIIALPGDRQQGMVVGPFTMASGDTQEVVIAFMGAFGNSRLDGITKLKETDYYVQKVFNSNFTDIEVAPNPPKVAASFSTNDKKVILSWKQDPAIENFNEDGYKFQGYNIFQVNEETQQLLATFDVVDGIKRIAQLGYDEVIGKEILKDVQFGTDSGLEYKFEISRDFINNSKLLKGQKYYFSVVAYTYCSDESKRIKTSNSLREFISFQYLSEDYGFNYGESFDVKHISGSSETKVKVNVYDADLITGDDYEISFSKQYYGLIDGEWVETEIDDPITTRMENHWNLLDKTTNRQVLEKQRIYEGKDIYAGFWNTDTFVNNPIGDGLVISLEYNFDPLITIDYVNRCCTNGDYSVSDFYSNGWAPTARSVDVFGNGVTSIDLLQKNYELRFTGIYETPEPDSIIYIKEGTGSLATLYGADHYSLADHPMNPTPGSETPFLVRIPFEVWNVDDDRQINLLLYDRDQNLTDKPFYAFNPNGRMYCEINNTKYNDKEPNSGNSESSDTDSLTWNLIFEKTDWEKNDRLILYYHNPIQIGVDKYTFSTLVEGKNTITGYSISQNYPNPFNPSTHINFVILNDSFVNLTVYDILGRKVKTLLNEKVKKGEYAIRFDGNNFSSGVYFYRFSAEDFVDVKKMILLK